MSQQKSRLLLIEISSGTGSTDYDTLGGMKTRNFTLSSEPVDTTTADKENPGGPVQKTSEYGTKSITFSGDGQFESSEIMTRVVSAQWNDEKISCRILVPGLGTFSGLWIVPSLEVSGGEVSDNLSFSASWEAAGKITFTPATTGASS
ncbi:phage tail tube protein [Roseibium sp. RKSG952]|uniref:phage tail tube protein n=1 Tax=Roseibium sp. RKSG952 TaxID=2529384 RepID=UPI0012BD149E|nr:phage tail tube protein [Roseibium sp. RKSG952]MTH96643.1 phage tail protein [Roseibium sp. RKSG952]